MKNNLLLYLHLLSEDYQTQEEFKNLCPSALGQWNGELWLFIYVLFKWFHAISFLHNFTFVMEKSNINSIPLLIFHGKHDVTNFESMHCCIQKLHLF